MAQRRSQPSLQPLRPHLRANSESALPLRLICRESKLLYTERPLLSDDRSQSLTTPDDPQIWRFQNSARAMEAAPLGWASELISSFTCCQNDFQDKRVITQHPAAKDSSPVATKDRRGSVSVKDEHHAKQALSKAREKMEQAHIKLDRSNEVTRQLSQQLTQVWLELEAGVAGGGGAAST